MGILTRPYTKSSKALVVDMVMSGKSVKEVARLTGVSDPTIRAWCNTSKPQTQRDILALVEENKALHERHIALQKASLEAACTLLLEENGKLKTRIKMFEWHAADRAARASKNPEHRVAAH